jgi:hypothetical protein
MCKQARLYTARFYQTKSKKAPSFSPEDIKKSLTDAKAPPYQPRNANFVPHRTDEEGNVTFDSQDTIEHHEEWARICALNQRLELEPETDGDNFFIEGSDESIVYPTKPKTNKEGWNEVLSKSQKRKLRKQEALRKGKQDEESIVQARPSSPSSKEPRPRRYIVDSGASFHLVDPRTLTKKERATIEELDAPIPIETANGEVTVTHRCRVRVVELKLDIWAVLHEDTVCVLSLGLLVDRSGFTYLWKPGKCPELKKGNFVVSCTPHVNVPFIYSAKARGLPPQAVSTGPVVVPSVEQIMKEEMKGMEDLIPPPPKPFKEDKDQAGGDSKRCPPTGRSRG